jgi:hypothetical protein
MPQVKGPAVISARDWLDARFGKGYQLEVAREVDPEFPERILPGDWYSVAPLVHVLDRSLPELTEFDEVESLVEVIAVANAKQDLRGIYRAFLWVTTPRMFLRAAPTIWANYANFGTLTEVENEPGRFVTKVVGIPEGLVGWLAGAWKGFLPPAVELAGGKNPVATVRDRRPSPDNRGGDGMWELIYQLDYD